MEIHNITVGSVNVSLIAHADRIVSHIRSGLPFERESLAMWADMCAAKGVVLDIGGYTGLFAIAAAKLGCEVWTFEPMPLNAARIRENAALNGVSIQVIECVVSDRLGEQTLSFNPKVAGFTAGASLVMNKGKSTSVRSVTVDSLNLSDVAAIKIDVERAEPLVLRGASDTLRRCKPMIIAEALGEDEAAAVMREIPQYDHLRTLDVRNMVLAPC